MNSEISSLLRITKADAAKRQLESAIRLWFHDGDPIAIHTLAAAAHQLVHDIGRKASMPTAMRSDTPPGIRPDMVGEFREAITRAENFFKHADRDSDAVLIFNPETTIFMLLDSIETYERNTIEITHCLKLFRVWVALHYPKILKEEYRNTQMSTLRDSHAGMSNITKAQFYQQGLGALARSEVGNNSSS